MLLVGGIRECYRFRKQDTGMSCFSFFRVLTLWFDYGHWPDVNEALVEGVKAIQIDTWLQVRSRRGWRGLHLT